MKPAPATPAFPPLSNPWSSWVELCLMNDLQELGGRCPACDKLIPDFFTMFRPAGLEYWRCLACLVRTRNNDVLMMPRVTPSGLDDDEEEIAQIDDYR